jgi:hypothetical protein
MLPDEAEGTIGLAIVAERRAALVVVENLRRGVIGAADVVDDAVGCRGDPFGGAAAHDLRVRKQPGQDNTRQQLIGMKTTGVGDEKCWCHVAVCPEMGNRGVTTPHGLDTP